MKRVIKSSCRIEGSKEQLYKDPNSVLGLSSDETISESELEDMWENNFLDDYTMEDFYNEFGEHQGKKEWLKETKKFLVPVESGTDLLDGDYIKARYELLDRKDVLDFDGFYTKYSMYKDTEDDRYVFVFGDPDIYRPEDEDFDYECESESEAYEWFDDYKGADEGGDIYSCSQPVMSSDDDKSVFMLMSYSSDPEAGMEGDEFYCLGKFFDDSLESAKAHFDEAKRSGQLSSRFKDRGYSSYYIDKYNDYFDDGSEVYRSVAELMKDCIDFTRDYVYEDGQPME